jgi:hypothetical protein
VGEGLVGEAQVGERLVGVGCPTVTGGHAGCRRGRSSKQRGACAACTSASLTGHGALQRVLQGVLGALNRVLKGVLVALEREIRGVLGPRGYPTRSWKRCSRARTSAACASYGSEGKGICGRARRVWLATSSHTHTDKQLYPARMRSGGWRSPWFPMACDDAVM